jgi:hypothetical protein
MEKGASMPHINAPKIKALPIVVKVPCRSYPHHRRKVIMNDPLLLRMLGDPSIIVLEAVQMVFLLRTFSLK